MHLPKVKQAIELKPVFKVKNIKDDEKQYRARLVAKEFQQKDRFDHLKI